MVRATMAVIVATCTKGHGRHGLQSRARNLQDGEKDTVPERVLYIKERSAEQEYLPGKS